MSLFADKKNEERFIEATEKIAYALENIGTGSAHNMGALEFLGVAVKEGLESVASATNDGLDSIASATNE